MKRRKDRKDRKKISISILKISFVPPFLPVLQISLNIRGRGGANGPLSNISFLFFSFPFSDYSTFFMLLNLGLFFFFFFFPLSRIRERTKPFQELNREACDDFKLCERYAMVYGYNAAYNRYFRQRGK